MPRPRYYVRANYHVWTVIDRGVDGWKHKSVFSIGARGVGDVVARAKAHAECERLNAEAAR